MKLTHFILVIIINLLIAIRIHRLELIPEKFIVTYYGILIFYGVIIVLSMKRN